MIVSPQTATRVLEQFEQDGSLRDIYVFGTDGDKWVRLVERLLESSYECEVRVGDSAVRDATAVRSVFESVGLWGSIVVDVGGAEIRSHLFASSEVEFYIDPRQWPQDKLFELFDFTSWLAAATSRNVFVTLENSPEHCIFALRHGGQEIILPARPCERTAFGRGIAGRLLSILDPFKQKSRSLFADVPRTGAALEAARAWAALDQANDIAWHTELTASEFVQLRDLSVAFESFFGTLSPEQLCEAGGFKLTALRRQFWETLEQTRVRFYLRL